MQGPANPLSTAAGFTTLAVLPDPASNVENVVFRNCTATRTTAANGESASGFLINTFFLGAPSATKAVLLENCVAEGKMSLAPSQEALTVGAIQGTGNGFSLFNSFPPVTSPDQLRSWLVSFDSCKALHNKGVPSVNSLLGYDTYSAGFFANFVFKASFYQCDADDNVYGFLLQASANCVVRDCRADNNVDLIYSSGTGAGFTDLGLLVGTPASPGISGSFFEFNHAYNIGDGMTYNGPNGNYNVFVAPATSLAMLEVQVSSPGTSYNCVNPTTCTVVHNVSTIP